MTKRSRSVFGVLALLLVFISSNEFAGWNTINLPELETVLKQEPADGNYMLIDSRPELKYLASHLPWAVSMPWQDMRDMLGELPREKEQKLIFYCGGLKCKLSQTINKHL